MCFVPRAGREARQVVGRYGVGITGFDPGRRMKALSLCDRSGVRRRIAQNID